MPLKSESSRKKTPGKMKNAGPVQTAKKQDAEAKYKLLLKKYRKLQQDYKRLKEAADRVVIYQIGAKNAAALGIKNVPPLEIKVGNKRIPR